MHRAGYRASEKGRFRCSSHAGVCTPSAAEELVAALVRGGRASEEEALLRGERHTREMRARRECTSSGRRTVDCGLRAAHAHAHALLLLRRMPDGPACVMAKGTVPLSSNGVCRYDVRTYIHLCKDDDDADDDHLLDERARIDDHAVAHHCGGVRVDDARGHEM